MIVKTKTFYNMYIRIPLSHISINFFLNKIDKLKNNKS